MDYKAVLEEQIEALRERQKSLAKVGTGETACEIAKTILALVEVARSFK